MRWGKKDQEKNPGEISNEPVKIFASFTRLIERDDHNKSLLMIILLY